MRGVLKMITALNQVGAKWSIEHPYFSYAWWLEEVKLIAEDNYFVCVDQCMYGQSLPESSARVRKRTKILTNCKELGRLACECDHSHEHEHAFGNVKINNKIYKASRLVAAYPDELCAKWASCVAACLGC